MKRNWIRTDRLWCLFLILAVYRVSGSSSKTIDQVKLPIPTRESLPQVAEVLRAAAYLEDSDEVDKNFQGQRNSYKRLPRKLGSENPQTNSELQEYQGVMGRPGVDFPILPSIPRTDFSCKKMKKSGYYADPETDCQVFHICDNGMKVSFLCPNGTVFRQSHLICDWWFRVDCERSIEMYEESAEQLATDQRAFKERTEALAKAMLKVQTTTTQSITDRVVTDRSFGPSTTVFNSESRLPDRARYFSDYSAGENQVPAETGSFVGNRFPSNFNNNYYTQSKSPVGNWDQTANIQSAAGNNNNNNNYYQTQSSTTAQPTWNQAANNNNNNNYQGGSNLQAQSSTTAQPAWNQATADRNNNNYNNNYYSYQSGSNQGQSLTTAQPTWNQVAVDINNNYQSGFNQAPSTTSAPQPSWNQAAAVNSNNNNYYQSGSYQAPSTTSAPQPSWNQAAAVNSNNNNYYQSGSYQAPSTTSAPQPSWNQAATANNNNYYQSGSYRAQSTTPAAQPTWNQAAVGNNYYQSGSYQSTTTARPVSGVQNVNSFNSDYQSQYARPSAQNQVDASGSQAVYQPQPTAAVPQPDPDQANNRNNDNDNNYQPGNSNKNIDYQTSPTTVAAGGNPWNSHQGTDGDFQTEVTSYQTSPTTTLDVTADGQSANNNNNNNYGGATNYPKPAKTTAAQVNGWSHQAVNDLTLSTDDHQSPTAVTTVQPDWNPQDAAGITAVNGDQQPQQLQSRQPYSQRPTASTFPAAENDKQNAPARESQVPAESASFVGHNNAPLYGFNLPNDYYRTLVPQTNPPATTYPATGSYTNDHPDGAFSYIEYNQDISTTVGDAVTTTREPPTTTAFDYTGSGRDDNSTLPPSGETLIPNMINSLQTFHADNNNNALYDTFDTSPTNADDDSDSVALYFNRLNDPQDDRAVTTVASDLQFNGYFEQTSRAYTNGISPFSGTRSAETTTPAVAVAAVVPSKGLHIPAVLTHNTKQAYDKLFTNDTKRESTTATATTATAVAAGQPAADVGSKGAAPKPGDTANLGLALSFNHSSAELRELAAVFTRALTAYLDDPENFRKILAEVRPTEPPGPKTGGGAADEQEVLDFSDDPKGGYRSTRKPTTAASGTPDTDGGVPQNVNALADLSTTIPHYTTSPLIDITSKFTEAPNAAPGLREYAPLADGEQLQTAGSHSFYSSRDNSVETPSKTVRPPPPLLPTSTLTWTVSPIIDTDGDTKATTPQLPPVYFTTAAAAEDAETTAIVQKAKEMFSQLNESDASILMNVMKTSHANDTVKRLVLLLVNDPNKENSPEQTRHNIIEALLDNRGSTAADQAYESSSPTSAFPPAPPGIPFGQRIHEDGTPIGASEGEQHKKSRKGVRRRVHVQRSRQVTAAAMTTPAAASNAWHGANDVGPGLSADSDARAVELLKSLYSIASKWS
ncbi:Chitin binding domain [Cinara cedri]|uniref:Chitin binding domain n=1 Tax=Cinara cedri TaxID=506608 RepID=A0A5E4N9T3_9HEMI|nr:Chitin binding domain [Cinara cedri]